MLREWFTKGVDPILKVIDGLDIGWGGIQRWATAHMPSIEGVHLDVACGYATFLAQLGWRFPGAHLVGLNIDFAGPHRLARPLLETARVEAELVQADVRSMPFPDHIFASASCFLGLQDIEIGFGDQGLQSTLDEVVRVIRPGGLLVVLDEFSFHRFETFLGHLPIEITDRAEKTLDTRWPREVAQQAIQLYARGWAAQIRTADAEIREQAYKRTHERMIEEMERQLSQQGYYVPSGPVRMVVGRKKPIG
jgi:ubiquinone/menaquinone biosynthesis C-methylase UbiE